MLVSSIIGLSDPSIISVCPKLGYTKMVLPCNNKEYKFDGENFSHWKLMIKIWFHDKTPRANTVSDATNGPSSKRKNIMIHKFVG